MKLTIRLIKTSWNALAMTNCAIHNRRPAKIWALGFIFGKYFVRYGFCKEECMQILFNRQEKNDRRETW